MVTDRPGSGKSTLAAKLAEALHLPLVSRDAIKEGMSPAGSNAQATDALFETIRALTSQGQSLIAEAAFQDHVWRARLNELGAGIDLRIILCEVPAEVAWNRVQERIQRDPDWLERHRFPEGHRGAEEPYTPPQLGVPTLTVDTTEGYVPHWDAILAFAR